MLTEGLLPNVMAYGVSAKKLKNKYKKKALSPASKRGKG